MKYVLNKAAKSNVIHGLRNVASAKTETGLLFWIVSLIGSLCFCAALLRSVSNQFYGDESIFQASIVDVHYMPPIMLCSNSLGNERMMQELGYPAELFKVIDSIQYLRSTGFVNTTAPDNEKTLDSLLGTGTNASNVVVQDVLRQMGHFVVSLVHFEARKYMLVPVSFGVSVELVSFGYCVKFDPSQTNLTSTGAQYALAYARGEDRMRNYGLDGFFLALSTDQPTFTPVDQTVYRQKETYVRIQFSVTLRRSNCISSSKSDASDCFYKCLESHVKCDDCELYNPAKNQTLTTVCLRSATCAEEIQRVSSESTCSLKCYRPCRVVNYLVSKHVIRSTRRHWELLVYLSEVNTVVSLKEIPAISLIQFLGYTGGNLGVFFGFNLLAMASLMKHLCKKRQRRIPRTRWRAQNVIVWAILLAAIAASSMEVVKTYVEEKTSSKVTMSRPQGYPPMFVFGKWLDGEKLGKAMSWENYDANRFIATCRFIQSLNNGDPYYQEDQPVNQNIEALKSEVNQALDRNSADLASFMLSIAAHPSTIIKNVTTMSGKPVEFQTRPVFTPFGLCYRTEFDYTSTPEFDLHLGGVNITFVTESEGSEFCNDRGEKVVVFDSNNMQSFFFQWTRLLDRYNYAIDIREKHIEKVSTNRIPCEPVDTKLKCMTECLDRVVDCPCRIFLPQVDPVPVTNVSQLCHRGMNFLENCFFAKTMLREDAWRLCDNQCINPCTQKVYNSDTHILGYVNDTVHSLHTVLLNLDYTRETFHLQEFLLYDIVQVFCTVGGLFGIIFGYSMISIFKLLLLASDKLRATTSKIGPTNIPL